MVQTQLNTITPGFASSLWALTYTVTPRLVIDAGFEAGITSGGPHRHVSVASPTPSPIYILAGGEDSRECVEFSHLR